MINYYELLNVPFDATAEEISEKIKSEYSRWRKRVNAPDPARQREAEERMEILHEAEKVLLNEASRAQYDRELSDYYAQQEQAQAQAQQSSAAEQSHSNQTREEVDRYITEADRFIHNQDYTNAIVAARRATELEGNNDLAWATLARARYHWGEIMEALYEVNRAIEIAPNKAYYYYLEYLCHLKREDIHRNDKIRLALKSLQKSLDIDPDDPDYQMEYANMMLEMDRYQEGINILTRLNERNQLTPFGKAVLSELYYSQGINCAVRVNYPNSNAQYYFVDKESTEQGLAYFQQALQFVQNENFEGEVRKWIGIAQKTLESELQIKFLLITIFTGFITFFFLMGGSVFGTIITGAITYLLWTKTNVPRYKLNEDYINSL